MRPSKIPARFLHSQHVWMWLSGKAHTTRCTLRTSCSNKMKRCMLPSSSASRSRYLWSCHIYCTARQQPNHTSAVTLQQAYPLTAVYHPVLYCRLVPCLYEAELHRDLHPIYTHPSYTVMSNDVSGCNCRVKLSASCLMRSMNRISCILMGSCRMIPSRMELTMHVDFTSKPCR